MKRVVFGVGALLASCVALSASKHPVPSDPLPGASRNDCFSIQFVKDRRVLDTKRLVVWTGRGSPYLIVLDRPLLGLDSGGHSITFVDGDGDGFVCRTLRDAVVVTDALLPKSRKVVGVTRLDEQQILTLEQKYETSLVRRTRGNWNADPQSDTGSAIEDT